MSTWHGRRGAVILGPTEDRVARFLEAATRHGRISLRTVELAERLHLERSEAYRITRRLRTLGLFGIENDRGGTRGGRRYWRTAIAHDGDELEAGRHRAAWRRVVAFLRARRSAAHRGLARLRQRPSGGSGAAGRPTPAAPTGWGVAGGTFAERMRRAGLGRLMDEWGVT